MQDEAEAISKYYEFMDSDFAKTAEAEPFIKVFEKIINDKRDHHEALNYLIDVSAKDKHTSATTELGKVALAEYKERNKLIK